MFPDQPTFPQSSAPSKLISLVIHALVLVLGFLLIKSGSVSVIPLLAPVHSITFNPPPRPMPKPPSNAGGGQHNTAPATKGSPPVYRAIPLLAPMAETPVQHPALPVPPALDQPTTPVPMTQLGDLIGASGPPSSGSGTDGIGGSGNRGVGPGPGGPNSYSSSFVPGGDVTAPRLIYRVDPEYSEEARKMRHQGSVRLQIVVDTLGHPQLVRVVQGLGLGLDERAIEALSHWRFEPGRKNGKPVPVRATVEITFRLL